MVIVVAGRGIKRSTFPTTTTGCCSGFGHQQQPRSRLISPFFCCATIRPLPTLATNFSLIIRGCCCRVTSPPGLKCRGGILVQPRGCSPPGGDELARFLSSQFYPSSTRINELNGFFLLDTALETATTHRVTHNTGGEGEDRGEMARTKCGIERIRVTEIGRGLVGVYRYNARR